MEIIVIKIVVPVQQDIDCITLTPTNRDAEFKSNGKLKMFVLLIFFYFNVSN